MCDSTYNKAIETKSALLNKKDDLKLEIAKRRELLEKKLNSDTYRNKVDTKVDKITFKLASIEDKIDKTNNYFRNEISKANAKLDTDIKALTDKFEKYREYCQSQMTTIEKNAEKTKNNLETTVEKLEKTSDVDEDADTILTNLKIKLEQLEKQIQEATNTVWKEEALLEKRMKAKQEEQILLCQQEQRRADEERLQASNRMAEERRRATEAEQERYLARRAKQDIVDLEEVKETEEEMKIRKKEERRLRKKEVDEFLAVNDREEKINNLTSLQQKRYYELPDNFVIKGKFLDAIK